MRPLGNVKVCMAAYGEKGLSLFLRPEKNSGILFEYISILALLLFTICANFKKSNLGKKSYEVLKFFLHGGLWAKKG